MDGRDSMTRFQSLADVWEDLFPASEAQVAFLRASFREAAPRRLVDVACGSGLQIEALTGADLECFGLDLEERMVARFRERCPALAHRVVVGDMRCVDEVLAAVLPGPAGVVSCIGNSLALLPKRDDVGTSLLACARLLAPQGTLVLQVVNFDRVLNGDLALLPTLERELPDGRPLRLERSLQPVADPGRLLFTTRLWIGDEPQEQVSEFLALRRAELTDLLVEAGLEEQEFAGDFAGNPWNEQAPATIVRASRSM